jgi:hypothetical protein
LETSKPTDFTNEEQLIQFCKQKDSYPNEANSLSEKSFLLFTQNFIQPKQLVGTPIKTVGVPTKTIGEPKQLVGAPIKTVSVPT